MNEILSLALYGLGAAVAMMAVLWAVSLKLRDASIVDRFWGAIFVLLAWVYAFAADAGGLFANLLLAMVTLWGLRLSLHISLRNAGHGEDYRYARMREEHGRRFWWYSFFSVFLLQGVIAWIVAAPLLFVMADPQPVNGVGFVVAGVALWGLGFFFEAVSDWQLTRFKRDPHNKGKLLTSGLWSLSRHPNYFGDTAVWWGYYLVAVSVSQGWMSAFGPLLMTLFIVFISGVAMMEKDQIRKRPEYADYIRSTPAFIPWPRFMSGRPALRRTSAVLAAFGLIALAALSPPRADAAIAELTDGQTVRFEVSDADSGLLLYSGIEQIRIRDGEVEKETVYRAPDRSEVLLERVRYDLDSLRVNELVSEFPKKGARTSLRRDGKRLYIEHVAGGGEPAQQSDVLNWDPQMRVGKTLHHMILRGWDSLVAGEPLTFDLLVPSKFDTYRFRLQMQPGTDAATRVFRLEPEAWLLRQFVSPMDFHYDEARRAVKYVGPSTVEFDDQPDRRVEIRFSY